MSEINKQVLEDVVALLAIVQKLVFDEFLDIFLK